MQNDGLSETGDQDGLLDRGSEDWAAAVRVLGLMLDSHDGCVSSKALRKELARKGITDARSLVVKMKVFDLDAEPDPDMPKPDFRFHHHGRSFYSEDKYRRKEAETDAAADSASSAEPSIEDEEEIATTVGRTNRQEEARLVTYVVSALEEWYSSDCGPEVLVSFDVHNQRAGTDFENVDAIAIHWRSDEVVDLVAVEVKLHFTSKLVQQANNYRRFSNRVWIAVPVEAQLQDAAYELRETDPLLFDYVVDQGIGVLACRRRQGGAYSVAPVHWPRLFHPDPVERDAFIERYRSLFEDAAVIAPTASASFPRLR